MASEVDVRTEPAPVPLGYCHCGCGEKTKLAQANHAADGHVKGEPVRFVKGHHLRVWPRYEVDAETGCWNWRGARNASGYAEYMHRRRKVGAHRFYYEQAKGPIPEGLQIDHLCRNRACVNPDHLEAVTLAENLRRGRGTKLTGEQVMEIRRSEETQATLAERFGISPSHVSYLRNRRRTYWEAA